jgi:hypothetical protein
MNEYIASIPSCEGGAPPVTVLRPAAAFPVAGVPAAPHALSAPATASNPAALTTERYRPLVMSDMAQSLIST